MGTVEVFKTDVNNEGHAERMVGLLLQRFPGHRINFDLEDCDRILRIEGEDFRNEKIIELLLENGFSCSVLD